MRCAERASPLIISDTCLRKLVCFTGQVSMILAGARRRGEHDPEEESPSVLLVYVCFDGDWPQKVSRKAQ